MWSFANRLAFILFFVCALAPAYIPFTEYSLFEEGFEDWSCWDVYYRRRNVYWPYFFVLGVCFLSYFYDFYRFWWRARFCVFFWGGVNSLEPQDRETFLKVFNFFASLVKFTVFGYFYVYYSCWGFFIYYSLFIQLKPWCLVFLGTPFRGVSLFADTSLCYLFDLITLYSIVAHLNAHHNTRS
jgi:hypothetical protein